MRKLLVIGIGAGNPEYVTVQAIKALNQARAFFVADKGDDKEALNSLRREICQRYIEHNDYRIVAIQDPVRDPSIVDYGERVRAWHEQRAELYEQAIARELCEDGCGAFLVWGDPSLYDSTLRISSSNAKTSPSTTRSSPASPPSRRWPPATSSYSTGSAAPCRSRRAACSRSTASRRRSTIWS
jgi:precorrin-6A synthase (deacetylating)